MEEGGAQISKSNVTGEDEKTMMLAAVAENFNESSVLPSLMLQVCYQTLPGHCIAREHS